MVSPAASTTAAAVTSVHTDARAVRRGTAGGVGALAASALRVTAALSTTVNAISSSRAV